MAFTLTGSVGRMGGLNREDDVRKVQNALNKVPQGQGRPLKPLDPDGNCGPKTIEAIQLFQIKHFGWDGADGRVDVDGPTHRKLNEFDGPGSTIEPVLTSESYTLSVDTGPSGFKDRDIEWLLLFTDVVNEVSRVFRLQQHVPWGKDKTREWGKPYPMAMGTQITADDLHDAKFAHRSTLIYDPKKPFLQQRTWVNVMVIQRSGEEQTVWPGTPTKIFHCIEQMHANPERAGIYHSEVRGQLELVEETESLGKSMMAARLFSPQEQIAAETAFMDRRRANKLG